MILFGGIHCEKLKCQFKDVYYTIFTLYSCDVTILDNSFNDMKIDGYFGAHLANKNDNDEKSIHIHYTNAKFIPENLGFLFNLTALFINGAELIQVRSIDFNGMQDLETFSLQVNKLTSLPSDVFSTLTKLKSIYLNNNKIKFLDSKFFNGLSNLNYVQLGGNICVNRAYAGATELVQLNRDIKLNCYNPLEAELNELKNELLKAKELQRMNELKLNNWKDDHQKECNENINLRAKLSKIEDELKKEQESGTECVKERDSLKKDNADLKMDLLEAKQINDVKVPKMEKTIEDFFVQVSELKREHNMERETCRELRSKLMKANEQLVTVDDRILV